MARLAVFMVFAFNGLVVGTWTGRVPALSRQVHAGPGELGLALLGTSIGLILTAPFAGRLCAKVGARPVVLASAVLTALTLPLIGVVTAAPLLGGVMFLIGLFAGALDVSMNVAAVRVVRDLDRPLMPTFHAAFSVGALVGALAAGWAVGLHWSTLRHFIVVAALGIALVASIGAAVPGARPDLPAHADRGARPPIRRPVLWLLAAVMLGSAIAEGASADWSALFMVRQRGVAESAATVAYAAFSVAMATARLLGERWERRWGAYRLLAGGATLAAAGFLAVVTVPWQPVSYVGFALAGAGLAFCFPVALGLAGAAGRRHDGSGGEREIGFVSTIAYTGFLAGPPTVGAIAQATNLSVALAVVGVLTALIVPAVLLARTARDRERITAPARAR